MLFYSSASELRYRSIVESQKRCSMPYALFIVTDLIPCDEWLEPGWNACATHVKAPEPPPLETRVGLDRRAFEKVGRKSRKVLIEYPQCS